MSCIRVIQLLISMKSSLLHRPASSLVALGNFHPWRPRIYVTTIAHNIMASTTSLTVPKTPSLRTLQHRSKSPNPNIEQMYDTQTSRPVLETSTLGASYLELDHMYHLIQGFRYKVVKDRENSMAETAAGIGAKDPQSAAFP